MWRTCPTRAPHAQCVIEAVLEQWPDERPPVRQLSLYVPAQRTELWRLWARTRFPSMGLRVRGVQRFTRIASKNAADMAIAVDAIHDFATAAASHIAVISNDSDFAALFVKLQELAEATGQPPPFQWITVAGASGISREIQQFVRADMRWDIVVEAPPAPTPVGPSASPNRSRAKAGRAAGTKPRQSAIKPDNREVAIRLIAELPKGTFKAQHALNVIARLWPGHPAAGNTQLCGQFLAKELWPHLQQLGVKMVRETSPRTYEIGAGVKTPGSP
ncbi:MAG: NYN domain-containing protein [Gammaproteobacteria bacterium]|nr:NYN domain-containing protein [Gammaproteobacteria bacterium]